VAPLSTPPPVIASNHTWWRCSVQAERVAATVGAPMEAFLDLARGSLADVAPSAPRDALTGPVRRGDTATVERHLEALPPRAPGPTRPWPVSQRLC
jgi:predicted short-subunit dehydrogenase-like oxidoreductase (DUF2520 family)